MDAGEYELLLSDLCEVQRRRERPLAKATPRDEIRALARQAFARPVAAVGHLAAMVKALPAITPPPPDPRQQLAQARKQLRELWAAGRLTPEQASRFEARIVRLGASIR